MKSQKPRRATILLMVVSLLALLFVLVTGFLSLARVNRGMVVDLRRGELADAIAEDTSALAVSLIKDQLVDDAGQVLGGGSPQSYSHEDVPGYRQSNWLAPLEPVWDPAVNLGDPRVALPATPSWQVLQQLRWPGVTSLDGSVLLPQPFALWELMRDYNFGTAGSDALFGVSDVQWNARNPFMDADGDGVPDSHFLLCAPVTEAANASAGSSVRLPSFVSNDPADINSFVPYYIPALDGGPAQGFRGEKWQRYDEQARYEVALRIISHGGMVTLDSPTLYAEDGAAVTPFNRDFTVDLFDAVRSPGDTRSMRGQYVDTGDDHWLFDQLSANVGRVEGALRRRFILPGPAELDNRVAVRRVPPILAELQGESRNRMGFPATFIPTFVMPAPIHPESWQRINLGVEASGLGEDERQGWAGAASYNPTAYNLSAGGPHQPHVPYDRRHVITTANYSDDLARKQTEGDPNPAAMNANNRLKTYHGELEFYLGEVAKAYLDLGNDQYAYDYYRGSVIIQRLARLFYDMLESHDASGNQGWGSVFTASASGPSTKQVVSRRQQAFMLAVNTVAFAAPRDTNGATRGFIDAVSYVQVDATGMQGTEYVGYAPQPFFSEAIAYNESDPNEPNDPDQVAIAVELYNPNDLEPGFDPNAPHNDPFALYLPQFAIAVSGQNPNDDLGQATQRWAPLANPVDIPRMKYMSGRSFTTFVIKDTTHSTGVFDAYVAKTFNLQITDPPGIDNRVKLDLWRQGRYYDTATSTSYTRWFHVDRIEVFYPDKDDWASRYRDIAQAIHPTLPDPALSRQPYFGVVGGTDGTGAPVQRWARWSAVCAWDDDDTIRSGGAANPDNEGGPATGEPSALALTSALGTSGQGAAAQFERNAQNLERLQPTLPITPLMTMNAGPVDTGAETFLYQQFNNLPMFGNPDDPRPRSFPTVGFMLFAPRYSHVHPVLPSPVGFPNPPTFDPLRKVRAMSQTLEKERHRKGYAGNQPWNVPADFGHMPIFDNNQDVKNNSPPGEGDSYLNHVGEVPWGLLVFDYFTTIDPQRDANNDGKADVDPLRIPGRININTAPWYVLANLPLLGPPDANSYLPIIPSGAVTAAFPSPAFWHPLVGVLTGVVYDPVSGNYVQDRLLATDPVYNHGGFDVPWPADVSVGRYRLGPWLAQSAAAYRDGVQYLPDRMNNPNLPFAMYADSHLRGGTAARYGPTVNPAAALAYRPSMYGLFGGGGTPNGGIRGAAQQNSRRPQEYGFITVGEFLNVKGFDSSRHSELPVFPGDPPTNTALGRGDFVKAVSLMVLLDSQYLTTRSNTFTIYASVMDRENPQASVRSQTTVDRSNLLPRLTYAYSYSYYDAATGRWLVGPVDPANPLDPQYSDFPLAPLLLDLMDASVSPPVAGQDGIPETPVRMTNDDAEPRILAEQRVGYFNARYDD